MNVIKAQKSGCTERCPATTGRARIEREMGTYLTDESRTSAQGIDTIYFPENESQLRAALKECTQKRSKVSIAGARTGIAGGAVPVESDAVISMERMDGIHGLALDGRNGHESFRIGVEAGLVLSQLQEALRNTRAHELPWLDEARAGAGRKALEASGRRLFYPVDPTEVSAQIGGTIATNASGARTFHYGPTRQWVESLRVVTVEGDTVELKRGECIADDGEFLLLRPDGSRTRIAIPELKMPAVKNTAGYYLRRDRMDAVDLFIGSEGTLCVIAGAELRLTFEPAERLFCTVFLTDESSAVTMVGRLKECDELTMLAIEYIDPHAVELLRRRRVESGASSAVPPLPADARCVLYLEAAFDGDAEFRLLHRRLEDLIAEAGGAPEKTWAGLSQQDMRAMKAFRHAVPEAVNMIIAERKRKNQDIHKIGTDMAVPDPHLDTILSLYRETLADSGLENVIFGHIGDNHLHVNILPESQADMQLAMELYGLFAARVVSLGGSVSAEHGIGRLKRELLRVQYSGSELAAMESIKRAFDPHALLSPGVIF